MTNVDIKVKAINESEKNVMYSQMCALISILHMRDIITLLYCKSIFSLYMLKFIIDILLLIEKKSFSIM